MSIKKAASNNKQHTLALATELVVSEYLPFVTIGFRAIFGPIIAKLANLSYVERFQDMSKVDQFFRC